MNTDRFLPIRIRTHDLNQIEQGLSVIDSITITAKINPMAIESYREAIPTHLEVHPTNVICTLVVMKSGDEFLVEMQMENFECLLNNFP